MLLSNNLFYMVNIFFSCMEIIGKYTMMKIYGQTLGHLTRKDFFKKTEKSYRRLAIKDFGRFTRTLFITTFFSLHCIFISSTLP